VIKMPLETKFPIALFAKQWTMQRNLGRELVLLDIHSHQRAGGGCSRVIFNLDAAAWASRQSGDGWFSVGMHPWTLTDSWPELLPALATAATDERVVLIGETGLDRLRGPLMKVQIEAFTAVAALAEHAAKPLLIHCVRAFEEILLLHRQQQPKVAWIIHGYNKSQLLAERLLAAGLYLSFGAALLPDQGPATFFHQLPAGRIFLETDMAAGRLQEIYARAAKLRAVSVEELTAQLWHNWQALTTVGG
jgi:TatD DNase family protein